VRLGALKSKLAVIEQRLVLLQAVGLLPHNLGLLQQERDVRTLARAVLDIFDRYGLPPEAEDEVPRTRIGRAYDRLSSMASTNARLVSAYQASPVAADRR